MTLQSSGAISLANIAAEFGGSAPHSLSEYYGAASGIPSSGTISFNQFYGKSAAIDIAWMLAAGGGGGNSGGGGAGGFRSGTRNGMTSGQQIYISIGGGGTGGRYNIPSNGGNSSMSGQVSASCSGGGNGGTTSGWAYSGTSIYPSNGGSGGGGGRNHAVRGTGVSGEGNAGGYGYQGANYGAGGGGGKNGGGGSGTSSTSGAGGGAISYFLSSYCGGGGGAITTTSGGAGGGGGATGGSSGTAGNAAANRGSGGGGGQNNFVYGNYYGYGGNGGSGVCVIRYAGGQSASGGSVYTTGGYTYHTFTGSGTFTVNQMAHFAKLDENNIVIDVVVVDNSEITDEDGNESEALGVSFLQGLFGADTNWKQTSYNSSFRGSYAGIGYEYRQDVDKFVFKPFPSWSFSTVTEDYEAPIPRPDGQYIWHEDAYQADTADPKTAGWELIEGTI